ncbi:MAG: SCP2 sterol-binding domain-containing protein [Cocleimonas sp.]|nr:SCP2 sterol-binding domain-containing protein [Cocleimonas sp.]
MKIPTPFLSAVETAINAWLKLDDEALPRLAELDGKIIRLHITGLDFNLYFFPSATGIQILGNYPSEEDGGVVDATIHGSPMALIRLGTSDSAGETLLKSDVEIDGDMHVAEKFSAILKEVDIDWEELLSKLVGDIIAHQAGQVARGASSWFTETVEAMKLNTGEYISEEAKLSPADAEIRDHLEQVDDVRMGVDRLEARINLLLKEKDKVKKKNKEKSQKK